MFNSELTVANSDDTRICGCVTMRTRVWTRVAVWRPWERVGDVSNVTRATLKMAKFILNGIIIASTGGRCKKGLARGFAKFR